MNVENRFHELPLTIAAEKGNTKITELLLENGANVNLSNKPLATAIEHGFESIVEKFLAHGANVNAQDSLGESSLSVAAYKGNEKIVAKLIANGANVNHEVSFSLNEVVFMWSVYRLLRNIKTNW